MYENIWDIFIQIHVSITKSYVSKYEGAGSCLFWL